MMTIITAICHTVGHRVFFILDDSFLEYPKHKLISISDLGNVYIADYLNNRVRKVTISTGMITTIAGTGTSSFSGDSGQATSAELYHPSGVALDSSGNCYPLITIFALFGIWYNL